MWPCCPRCRRPMALGFKTDEIQRTIAIGEPGSLSNQSGD